MQDDNFKGKKPIALMNVMSYCRLDLRFFPRNNKEGWSRSAENSSCRKFNSHITNLMKCIDQKSYFSNSSTCKMGKAPKVKVKES